MKNPYPLLKTLGVPVGYFTIETKQKPYLVYMGNGANTTLADNRVYYSENRYVVEYYFDKKDEDFETDIENLFNEHGIVWEKSEDVYIDTENMFLIYYYLN